ncbi:hypothetical protein K4K49_008075 [Colletotrichum sp. SAR 10_70]|nr:hypothetical protein K4K50_004928 [Colletotrichum sp. SAR 10_71]KAI8158194.1 hypothetical protein K4K49_008075 [Colletotrichum sp. SAR 10_70]
MTNNAPAGEAVRPRLDTNTNWALPRDQHPDDPESEELSPLSPGREPAEYTWGEQKEGHGPGEGDARPAAAININIPSPLMSRTRESMGSMSSDMMEELRKIIKEEVQAAQVVHLKNSETGTPIDAFRFPPISNQNTVFTPAYPSPPPSVVDTINSKISSPRERSPEVTGAKVNPAPHLAPPPAYVPPSVSEPEATPPISPQQRAVRFRNRGPPVIHCQTRIEPEAVSPTAPIPGRVELSSVDKAWGVLFDLEGYGTQRLNSVLRGLASYMIAEFSPPETLVVTPEKMLCLYTKYKIEPERFQYEDIFRSRSKDALERIEYLYQDLDCQYHLVQSTANPKSKPNVPALTPIGFAKWMVSNILAYPDPEARRLHTIMSSLPINADGPLVDGKAERLPKQLSRHLFPEHHDKKTRSILDEAMLDCLEDAAPPLPSIPRSRPSPSDNRPAEANIHSRRSFDDRKRPNLMAQQRSRTYDRGTNPQPARLPRANSDAGASVPRHRDLSPPPMGRHSGSGSSQRRRSPPPVNRTTYDDNNLWDRYVEYIRKRANESIDEYDEGHEWHPHFRLFVIEGPDLRGASIEHVRTRFATWRDRPNVRAHGVYSDIAPSKYFDEYVLSRFPLYADAECLESFRVYTQLKNGSREQAEHKVLVKAMNVEGSDSYVLKWKRDYWRNPDYRWMLVSCEELVQYWDIMSSSWGGWHEQYMKFNAGEKRKPWEPLMQHDEL